MRQCWSGASLLFGVPVEELRPNACAVHKNKWLPSCCVLSRQSHHLRRNNGYPVQPNGLLLQPQPGTTRTRIRGLSKQHPAWAQACPIRREPENRWRQANLRRALSTKRADLTAKQRYRTCTCAAPSLRCSRYVPPSREQFSCQTQVVGHR